MPVVGVDVGVRLLLLFRGVELWNRRGDRGQQAERERREAQQPEDEKEGEESELANTPPLGGALLVSGVEPAARNKTYEAWVIVGRKPRPAGLFRGPASVALGDVPDGATVAVTLEKRGGARTPTGALLFSAKTA